MFWREREEEKKEVNGGTTCGQVRVLVVGDSVLSSQLRFFRGQLTPSKTGNGTIVEELTGRFGNGGSAKEEANLSFRDGDVKNRHHTTYGNSGSSSNSIKGDGDRNFFVELWDVSGHDRYKDCRSLFYSHINGVIFVHDLSQRRTKTSLQKWAVEIAATGTFSVPLGSGGPGGLPIPYIVIGNKADIAAKDGTRGSSGNLVDAARHWVEKQGLLPSSEELPLTESFPGSGGLVAAAKGARYDKEAVMKFFRMLIRRRYFSDDLPAPNSWSTPGQRLLQRSSDNFSDEDQVYKSTSLTGDPYEYNVLPPLPAQCNLTPPPTLYPQRPMLTPENNNIPRFALAVSQEIGSARSKRSNINV
ncbi:hypothetical protein RHGRI_022324 [Rhododendron griersonianum]|uniref:Uncharacterized protein n=1 Tax=Rhododendron griersonianum TaxID=479676 RepID=A0AAV6J3J1_9ERIC|nr:hypothetical protein RHGRI_022324 [Rhododendron griersonianum]